MICFNKKLLLLRLLLFIGWCKLASLSQLQWLNNTAQDFRVNNTGKSFQRDQRSLSEAKFIPWPHAKIFDGYLESGVWVAGNMKFMKKRLEQDFDSLDTIQDYAIRDGIFFPKPGYPKFHIYSSDEAISCFKGKKIFFTGDSYMVQMFIGLSEILLGQPSNEEIKNGKHRDEVFAAAEHSLKKRLGGSSVVKFLYYHCHLSDCTCVNGEMIDDESWKSGDALIASIYIHYKNLHINDPLLVENYAKETAYFFENKEEKKLTWISGLSFRKPFNSSVVMMNLKAIEEAKKHDVPLVDIFSMTEMCVAANCSTDGGHKSRYVNRMKAQMLLNNLCNLSR